ncbi:EAL domain-containing protein [Vibrio amylolyticus]|uniref:EAL domain-containing protein n=1 Tax=Vibrio amylolyticus TaxID=2847292 RepID=UPI00354AE817
MVDKNPLMTSKTNNTVTKRKRLTIGVIMPMLSGFYMGELNATIRQMATRYDVNLIVVRSGHHRDFSLPVSSHHFDALIVILHAASDHLIQDALNQNIPVISLGASYYPLQVEHFYSVQSDGVEQLYQWLRNNGHEHIGFCGDLSVNDIRIRFKAYQHAVEDHQGRFNPQHFFSVSSCSLAGGREAAVEYAKRTTECTAIICATDHNAIGMIEQLKHFDIYTPTDIAIVGIDNVFFGQQMQPALTTSDQQLEPLARQAFLRALERAQGQPFSSDIYQLPQKLVIRQSCGNQNEALSKNEDKGSIRHALLNVEGRSPSEIFENFYSQAQNGFNSILDAQSLYGNSLTWACLAHCNAEQYHVVKWVEQGMTQPKTLPQRDQTNDNVRDFPFLDDTHHYSATVMPISTGQSDQWKLVAVVDSLSHDQNVGTQSVFHNYLDMLSLFVERDSLLDTSEDRQKNSLQLLQQLKIVSNTSNDGIWDWDLKTNRLRWNSRLIKMLGDERLSARRHIDCDELFKYIHPSDIGPLEDKIRAHLINNEPFRNEFRLMKVDGTFIWVQANGSAVFNAQNKPIRFIGSMTDITKERENAAKIHHMAYFDALTGVANRRKVMEDITEHTETKPNLTRAVMLMDLNRFKMVNDTFGHHIGDALLCHITTQLKQSLSTDHTIARFGGDEFLFFCNVENREKAHELARFILKAIEAPMHAEDIELNAQGSIGIAMYPNDGDNSDVLIKKADMAMYQAKQLGGREVSHYNSAMKNTNLSSIKLEHHLNTAIDTNEIEVYYQPQWCPKDKKVIAVEALARWFSPELGSISPMTFIEVAEKSGMIGRLGNLILNQVCRDVKRSPWLKSLRRISVNVSAKQLIQPHFANDVIETILKHELELSQFCIEITETAAIGDYELCVKTLETLHKAGIPISLDDFGTGYSSLSLLQKLPLSEVKIDRSFIAEITKQKSHFDFVSAMVSMGRSFGYQVVAEGVEELEHVNKLKDLDVDLLQGYFYSKPQSIAELEAQYMQPEIWDTSLA